MPDGKGETPHLGTRRTKVDRDVLTHNLNDTVPPTGWESRGSPQTTPPTIEILGGGVSMNKQDSGFLQSRKLEEVQLPKALPPRTGSSHVGNNGTCAAPSSAAAL